jgi:hypothetical protein
MARIRTIKPEFWTDAALMECSVSTRLLFIGTWNFADDNGNLDRSAKQIKARVFPADAIDCEPLIQQLMTHGLLIEYAVNGKKYLHIQNFTKHQVINRPSSPHCPLHYDSLNTHGVLHDDSLREGKGREGNGKEGKVKEGKKTSIPMPEGIDEEIWKDFLKTRTKPITETGLKGIAKQAVLAGISLEAALQECCTRGWQSFKAEWINKTQGAGNGKFNIHAAGRESLARALAEEAMGTRAPWEVPDAVHEPVQQLLPRSSDD